MKVTHPLTGQGVRRQHHRVCWRALQGWPDKSGFNYFERIENNVLTYSERGGSSNEAEKNLLGETNGNQIFGSDLADQAVAEAAK